MVFLPILGRVKQVMALPFPFVKKQEFAVPSLALTTIVNVKRKLTLYGCIPLQNPPLPPFNKGGLGGFYRRIIKGRCLAAQGELF